MASLWDPSHLRKIIIACMFAVCVLTRPGTTFFPETFREGSLRGFSCYQSSGYTRIKQSLIQILPKCRTVHSTVVQFRVPHSVLGYLFAQGCDACQEEAAAVTGTWTSLGWYPWCHGPILSGSPVDSSPPLPKGSTSLHTGCPHFVPSLSLTTGSFGTQET